MYQYYPLLVPVAAWDWGRDARKEQEGFEKMSSNTPLAAVILSCQERSVLIQVINCN